MIKIAVIVEQCEEGGFAVRVPTLPGCYGQGETVDEALASIRDAIEMHLEAVDDDLVVDDDSEIFELTWDTAPQTKPRPGLAPQRSPNHRFDETPTPAVSRPDHQGTARRFGHRAPN
jgi:antitoxin HicB